MDFDSLISIARTQHQQPEVLISVPKDWSQGRTVFGGLSAAILYSAAREYIEEDRQLRSMTTNFVGPLLFDTPFQINVEIVREGKNVSQVLARIIQEDKNCVLTQFCFAKARQSKTAVKNNDQHNMAVPKKANFIPNIPKVTPNFLRHYELSIDDGGLPFTGKKSSHYYGWMRFKESPQTITEAHIISMIDAWPPTLIQQLRWPAPASTVSWNLEFIYPHRPFAPSDWLAYKEDTRQAADGYGHTEATIWDIHGEVIALSRQTTAVFD
jgi:acyl-CoA thioesterase II